MAEHRATNQAASVYRVVLQHGPHSWTFAFTPQDAAAAIRRVRELALDPGATLDRFDALLLTKQIRRAAQSQSETLVGPDAQVSRPGPPPNGSPDTGDEDLHGR